MENEIPYLPQDGQEHPTPPPAKPRLKKRLLIFGLGALLIVSMGTYVIVSPSQDQRSVAFVPPPEIPTPTQELMPTPTNKPTPEVIPLPTAAPPTSTPTPTIPPGTAWKTYANTQYGYRIKYSPDWVAKDLGALEPKIPSYIAFNDKYASDSSRFITIGVTTRTYEEQLALGASSSAITVAGIKGTKQFFQDSDGNTSTVVVLPMTNHLIVLRAKTPYLTYFNLMLSTLYVAK